MSENKVNDIYKITDKAIYGFFKEHRFLSNFDYCNIPYEGLTYLHTEGAFQAAKTLDENKRLYFMVMTPSESKAAGRKVNLRTDWEKVKIDIMRDLLLIKFTHHLHLKAKLIATGDKYLEETNWWGDTFWGVCNGVGENHLGKLLMEVRNIVKAE